MKALIGLAGGAAVVAFGGVDQISTSMGSLAVVTAVGCWVVSGWIAW